MPNCCSEYPDHSGEITRLNRIIGQLEGVRKMIEDRKYCPDILNQIKAASSATKSLEAAILESHLRSCVRDAMVSGDEKEIATKIDELMTLFKRIE